MAETALKQAVFTISNKEKRILEDENRYQYLKIRTNPKGDTTYCRQKKAQKCTASAITITKFQQCVAGTYTDSNPGRKDRAQAGRDEGSHGKLQARLHY